VVGEKIKEWRIRAALTQRELASKVNVSGPMITMIERGTKTPSLLLSKEIADVLGCSILDFLDKSYTGRSRAQSTGDESTRQPISKTGGSGR